MSSGDEKTLEKATELVVRSESVRERYTKKFFDKIDKWERVFELRSQGMTYEAVAKVLGLTRSTAYKYYDMYIRLKQRVLETKLEESQVHEIVEYVERLEKQREELAWEVASMTLDSTSGVRRNPTADEQMAKMATRKMLLEVEKQIANVKKGLGLWQPLTDDHFKKKRVLAEVSSYDEKKKRLALLLKKALA